MTIIAAYQDTGTYRGAAAICGTTHKTVKRVVERAQAGGVRPASKERARNFEVVAGLVAERVKKSSGRITAKRLLNSGLTGPLTIGFTAASQPAWWIIAGCGLAVLGIGALTSGRWAVGTAARTAHLFEDQPANGRPHRAA
jgi:hypothetical protein